jgi:hypothetical protein
MALATQRIMPCLWFDTEAEDAANFYCSVFKNSRNCWKVLIALYENDTPFEPHIVDLGGERSSTEFKRIWPIGKFPVLHDKARNVTVPESSIIIEYLSHPRRSGPGSRCRS